MFYLLCCRASITAPVRPLLLHPRYNKTADLRHVLRYSNVTELLLPTTLYSRIKDHLCCALMALVLEL